MLSWNLGNNWYEAFYSGASCTCTVCAARKVPLVFQRFGYIGTPFVCKTGPKIEPYATRKKETFVELLISTHFISFNK